MRQRTKKIGVLFLTLLLMFAACGKEAPQVDENVADMQTEGNVPDSPESNTVNDKLDNDKVNETPSEETSSNKQEKEEPDEHEPVTDTQEDGKLEEEDSEANKVEEYINILDKTLGSDSWTNNGEMAFVFETVGNLEVAGVNHTYTLRRAEVFMYDKDTWYNDDYIKLTVDNEVQEDRAYSYVQEDGKEYKAFEYKVSEGKWKYGVVESNPSDISMLLDNIRYNTFDGFEYRETDGHPYLIAESTYKEVCAFLNMDILSFTSVLGNAAANYDVSDFDVQIAFRFADEKLDAIAVNVNDGELSNVEMCRFAITFSNMGETNVEVPAELVEGLNGSGNGSSNEGENTSGVSNKVASADWTDYEFTVGNTTLTLPCNYKDLVSLTGFAMTSEDAGSILKNDGYTTVTLYTPDNKYALFVQLLNTTGSDATYESLPVVEVWQAGYQVESGAAPIVFPGGLVVGTAMTGEELIRLFGEPDDFYRYDSDTSDYWSETYTWCADSSWTYRNCFEVTIEQNQISELSLNHMNY